MTRARTAVALVAVWAVALVPVAFGAMTKEEIRDRSAEICAHATAAMKPHSARAERAADRGAMREFLRHARRAVAVARRHVERLAELRPPAAGRRRYRTFVDESRIGIRWGGLAFEAFAAERYSLMNRRIRKLERHAARAERAARRYPLRRACIKFID